MARVLLVEPDIVLAKIYTKALKHVGYQVSVASDAQTAVDAADKDAPDVVVLEMQLAGHNGMEFLYEFRSYADWQKVPVIVHSVVPPGQFLASADTMSMLNVSTYLYKPQVSLAQLIRTLGRILPAQIQT